MKQERDSISTRTTCINTPVFKATSEDLMQKMPQSHTFILLRHLHEHEIACVKSLSRQAGVRRDGCIYWLKYGNSTNPTHRLRITISSKKTVNSMKWLERRIPQELRVLSRSKGKAKLAIFRLRLRLGGCCVELHNGNVLSAKLLNGQ